MLALAGMHMAHEEETVRMGAMGGLGTTYSTGIQTFFLFFFSLFQSLKERVEEKKKKQRTKIEG